MRAREQTTTKSSQMARIRTRHTAPELTVRRMLTAGGVRYRLHRRSLPGTPDIYVGKLRIAIFVNGCFWHGHHCRRGELPVTNVAFWRHKIGVNRKRDVRNVIQLRELGVEAITIWGCDISRAHVVCKRIARLYRAAATRGGA